MPRLWFRTPAALIGLVAVLTFVASCSSSKSVEGVPATDATTTSVVPATSTTVPPVTDSPTTVPETTTTAPTTTTTTPAPAAGWTAVDPAMVPGPQAFPCCASNWTGVASPALPAAGGTLPDGNYPIRFDWPSDFSQPVTATVTRFELCSVLPAGGCEDNGGGAYAPDEMGLDDTTTFELAITFDDQLQVQLGGFNGWDTSAFAVGNGIDLAELVTALDADYQVAIMQPLLAGATEDDITAALTAAPAYGFGPPATESAGRLVYTHGGAPPLLFQVLTGYDDTPDDTRGSDVIGRIALVISGGKMTLNLYAGFYS